MLRIRHGLLKHWLYTRVQKNHNKQNATTKIKYSIVTKTKPDTTPTTKLCTTAKTIPDTKTKPLLKLLQAQTLENIICHTVHATSVAQEHIGTLT